MGGPKLLDKKLVNAEVATQRKQLIDAGLTIAKKVDVVRETLQTEERSLEEFRTYTTAQVRIEIDALIQQKDNLKDEIIVLERQKEIAHIPLDSEWEKLKEATVKLLKDKQVWNEKSDMLSEREVQIERKEQEVENDKKRSIDLKHRASEALTEADTIRTNAREAAAEIRNKAQAVLSAAEAKEREVSLKEKELEVRESDVEKTKERQQQKDIKQADCDREIQDRYATLERTIKRLGIKI